MHSRVMRVMLAALVLLIGIGAAAQLAFLLDQSRQLAQAERELGMRLGHFDVRLTELAAAQRAYLAPGQPDAPWFERVSALTAELRQELGAIRSSSRSADSASSLQGTADALNTIERTDAVVRDYLAQQQDLMASDALFGEARDAINAARADATRIMQAEIAAIGAEQASRQRRALLVASIAGGIVIIGVLLLAPRTSGAPPPAAGLSEITRLPAPPADAPAALATVDLQAAADLCSALSRVVSSAALPDMLARAAALIDAAGIIVWMGTGDELFAVLSHGYDPRSIRRLGAIPRDADNATAEAWRTGEMRTVAGDMVASGAIVAPMFGPDSCVGVLTAEVRHGREQDPATQAVTVMIASQLATIVGAWPAAPPARAAEA